ncbi:hypothetical protein [Methylobacterium mesophilicum]|uniref:hypothetical protein n=1 Tax=Methylobacterium mesophilicum TaxID=39956 RepID=UPI002F35E601
MERGDWFDLRGNYRVQSKRQHSLSRLSGHWATLDSADLNSAAVNAHLRLDPQWRGQAKLEIRPALVERRAGEFAKEPDILYKRSNFIRSERSETMPSDIIDVRKALNRWRQRRSFTSSLLGHEVMLVIEKLIGDIEQISAIEYYVHEAGHCIGYDTDSKYRDGYFKVGGKTVWPLVYIEEFRADLLGFGFAASLLPSKTASSVFFYNVLLRLSSHIEGVRQYGHHPYGVIPFLLYATLRRSGLLGAPLDNGGSMVLNITTFTPEKIVQYAHQYAALARSEAVELDAEDGSDAAIRAALFYRSLLHQKIVDEFDAVVKSILIDCPH